MKSESATAAAAWQRLFLLHYWSENSLLPIVSSVGEDDRVPSGGGQQQDSGWPLSKREESLVGVTPANTKAAETVFIIIIISTTNCYSCASFSI